MPWESPDTFFGLTERVGRLTVIKRRVCGTCSFYHVNRCSIYERRPFACSIYPYILEFKKHEPTLALDLRAPCSLFVQDVQEDVSRSLQGKVFPRDWVRAFELFSHCLQDHAKRGGHGKAQV